MIKVDIFAGLGNQLFEYAYARALSLEYNEPIVINTETLIWLLINLRLPGTEKCYGYQLKYFNITPCVMQNPVIGFLESINPALHVCLHRPIRPDMENFKKMSALFLKVTAKGKYYFADIATNRYYPHCRTNKKTKHVHGIWQSEKYFANYSETIRKELRVITPISEKNQIMIKEMQSCNSVAIHFRLGEYVENKTNRELVHICTEEYYKRGMCYIAEHTLNPVFYIFSNDIQWIKNNIKFDYPVKFVDNNNPGYEDLRLMYNCRHFIIANSTFSWWGSYLSDNKDKIVVAPSYWIRKYANMDDIYRNDMILINPDEE
jgi:hypothetical protein